MREKVISLSKKDFIIQTFRAGGKGGQKQNKTSSGVRIQHEASGAVGESREHRSQHSNMKAAFIRLTESAIFKKWLKMEISRVCGRLADAEAEVERLMQDHNIRTEVTDDQGRWHESKIDNGHISE